MATAHWISEVPEAFQIPGTNQLLGGAAVFLLGFVTISVIYLSVVDRLDRRRRKKTNEKVWSPASIGKGWLDVSAFPRPFKAEDDCLHPMSLSCQFGGEFLAAFHPNDRHPAFKGAFVVQPHRSVRDTCSLDDRDDVDPEFSRRSARPSPASMAGPSWHEPGQGPLATSGSGSLVAGVGKWWRGLFAFARDPLADEC